MPETRHVVARVGDVPENSSKLVAIKGRPIALFHVAGEYFAIHNNCPHEGGSLCHGYLVGAVQSNAPGVYEFSRAGELVQCPWHGWEFDLRTGRSWCDPGKVFAKSYKVEIRDGRALAEGPYVAETFPVSVDGDYIVITM
jgi:nitrite reductase/ring-hydroxylating ferredoxin subunit